MLFLVVLLVMVLLICVAGHSVIGFAVVCIFFFRFVCWSWFWVSFPCSRLPKQIANYDTYVIQGSGIIPSVADPELFVPDPAAYPTKLSENGIFNKLIPVHN